MKEIIEQRAIDEPKPNKSRQSRSKVKVMLVVCLRKSHMVIQFFYNLFFSVLRLHVIFVNKILFVVNCSTSYFS